MRILLGSRGTGERGITPVVGTILLIGLTIGAVSMVAVTVGQMQPTSRAPQVELGDIRVEMIQENATKFVTRVSFTHRGGDFLWPRELRVTINGVNNLGVESSTSIKSTSDNFIKFGNDTACLLANWQDFSTERGKPYYENGTTVEIFIVHDPSGTVLANVTSEVSGPLYLVYDDSGIPPDSEIWTWDGVPWGLPAGTFDGNYTGESPPEGSRCFKTTSGSGVGNYAGWGVFLIYPAHHTVNLSLYKYLKFWVKTPANLKVEIEAPEGATQSKFINSYGWDGTNTWQEITIPASAFVNLNQVYCPFKITIDGGDKTFYVDQVRWV